jgi:hypothetical protein
VNYSVSVSGHTPGEDVERELADRLSEIVADPKYGADSATFNGSFVHGDLRTREGWLKAAEAPDAG